MHASVMSGEPTRGRQIPRAGITRACEPSDIDSVGFYFMCMGFCLHVCMYVCHVSAVPEEVRRGRQVFWYWGY